MTEKDKQLPYGKSVLDWGPPVEGGLYMVRTANGADRLCRYGCHRKRDPDNWKPPSNTNHRNFVWRGWRDDTNYRFLRDIDVLYYTPVAIP
jgi:hypothetical protein